MLRVLLVIDDYNELGYLQTLLRKMGFDVDGLQNQRKLAETVMVFNPQVIVATAKGKRINGMQVIKQIIRKEAPPKLIFLENQRNPLTDAERAIPQISEVLASPVNAKTMLESLARLGNMDLQPLLEKFSKISAAAPDLETQNDDLKMFKSELDVLQGRPVSAEDPVEDSAAVEVLAADSFEKEVESQMVGGRAESEAAETIKARSEFEMKPSTLSAEDRQQRFGVALDELDEPTVTSFDTNKVRGYNKVIRAEEKTEEQKILDDERRAFVRSLFRKGKS